MNIQAGNEVLIMGHDHAYDVVYVRKAKVTWNPEAKQYFEYAGDEHLEPGEVVVERNVID